jgi:hypothetical protein
MELPIAIPSVKSYMHHANQLAVAETDPSTDDYLMNYHLQVYRGRREDRTVDFYAYEGMYPRYPLVVGSWIPARTLRRMGQDVVAQAQAILLSGCWVEGYLDEYHVSTRNAYAQEHVLHQNLIFGFDEDKHRFMAQGFTREGYFWKVRDSVQRLRSGDGARRWIAANSFRPPARVQQHGAFFGRDHGKVPGRLPRLVAPSMASGPTVRSTVATCTTPPRRTPQRAMGHRLTSGRGASCSNTSAN